MERIRFANPVQSHAFFDDDFRAVPIFHAVKMHVKTIFSHPPADFIITPFGAAFHEWKYGVIDESNRFRFFDHSVNFFHCVTRRGALGFYRFQISFRIFLREPFFEKMGHIAKAVPERIEFHLAGAHPVIDGRLRALESPDIGFYFEIL